MFGRKIVIRPQMVPVYYIPPVRKGEPEIVTGRDKNGYEYTIKCNYKSSMPRPPPPQKPFVEHHDPSYNDVFKFFGDIADYNINEVVFTLSNEPGSIPIDDKLSFIPPTHLQGWERAVTYDYVSSPQGISVRVA
ncbi:uncharacterized protein LOC126786154 [Argentina anserina]|uniref:uncharacterized protein LOC126786154 n=1 Tax=Argentina anserina TaxID=57926 RepID=UPI0021768A44|nr:uncharacterized protein LOC126786154 [Potentilla anserina]